MTIYYLSAAECIRRQRFEVQAPAFYHPNENSDTAITKRFKREPINPFRFVAVNQLNPAPFRIDVDPDEMQNCSYTIEIMVDMFRKKIPFTVVHDHDIPTIFDALDRYLLSLQSDVIAGVESSTEYAKLVIAWRAEVYKHYFRYMKTHPAAMEELYPKNDPVNNIFTLMADIGGMDRERYRTDPLAARAKPPYAIAELSPKPKTDTDSNNTNSDLDDIGSSLGLSYHSKVQDTWNHEEFLKGIKPC